MITKMKLGTFRNALPIGVDHFREFPEAVVRRLPSTMKEQPIVMSLHWRHPLREGGKLSRSWSARVSSRFSNWTGASLKYFEESRRRALRRRMFCHSDQRVGLDPSLQETESTQCFRCQTPLSEGGIRQTNALCAGPVVSVLSFKTPAEQMATMIRRINVIEAIARAMTPPAGQCAAR